MTKINEPITFEIPVHRHTIDISQNSMVNLTRLSRITRYALYCKHI